MNLSVTHGYNFLIPLFVLSMGLVVRAETRIVSGFDSTAIAETILQSRSGDTVMLPAGTFSIAEPLTPQSGTRLIGAGQDKTLVQFAGTEPSVMLSLSDCENVEISHFTLDAQNKVEVSQGIVARNSRRLNLHHVTIRNLSKSGSFGPHGILFSGINPTKEQGVIDSEISDCLIENIGKDAEFGSGIRLAWGSSRNRVIHNTIRTTGRGGIFGDSGSTDLVICDNRVSGSGGAGLGIEVWNDCDRTVIEDNRIDHWLSISGSDHCAVRRNVVSDKSGTVKFAGIEGIGEYCVYTENVIDDGQQIGISVSGDAVKDHAYWGHNSVEHCIQWATQFQGESNGIAQHYFYRCKFNGTSATRGEPIYPQYAGHGFRTNGNVRQFTFEECEFSQNVGYGIQFGGNGLDGFAFQRCIIRDNGGQAMVGLQEYDSLEWIDCIIERNKADDRHAAKPFPHAAPIAAFDAPANARTGEFVRFVSSSRAADGEIEAVLWDFGDGVPSSISDATHKYMRPGVYRVTLIAWDKSGRAARAAKQIQVE